MNVFSEHNLVVWITGLSGSGKTTLAKKLLTKIKSETELQYVLLDGDDIRNHFGLHGYDTVSRKINAQFYSDLARFFTIQNLNVIVSTVSLFHEIHTNNRKIHKNYFEIFLNKSIDSVISKDVKSIYKKSRNVVGRDIKPEFPLNPDIILNNLTPEKFEDIFREIKGRTPKKLLK